MAAKLRRLSKPLNCRCGFEAIVHSKVTFRLESKLEGKSLFAANKIQCIGRNAFDKAVNAKTISPLAFIAILHAAAGLSRQSVTCKSAVIFNSGQLFFLLQKVNINLPEGLPIR